MLQDSCYLKLSVKGIPRHASCNGLASNDLCNCRNLHQLQKPVIAPADQQKNGQIMDLKTTPNSKAYSLGDLDNLARDTFSSEATS